MIKRVLIAVFVLVVVSLAFAPAALADETKDYYWKAINVDLDIRSDSTVRVTETHTYVFTVGSFSHVYRVIPTGRVESIDAIEVWEGNTQYRQASSQTAGTYTVERSGEEIRIDWWFPRTSGQERTFTLEYTLYGGLRFYDGGDQLWWKAVFADRAKPVQGSVVTVHLPSQVSADQLVFESYGTPGSGRIVDSQTVQFIASRIQPGDEFEVRVQFPHGLVAGTAPRWQEAFDQKVKYDEETRPIVTVGLALAGLAVMLLGALFVLWLWYTRGRDRPVGKVAEYLTSPPSDLAPGVVGVLIDEKADMKDVVATIVHLAQKGVIRMTEKEIINLLFFKRSDIIYELVDRDQAKASHERELIDAMFGLRNEVSLLELKNKFYKHLPGIKDRMYDEAVNLGYFSSSPQSTRRKYGVLGGLVLVAAVVVGAVAVGAMAEMANTAFCPAAGLGFLGLGLIVVGPWMPRRTLKGAEERTRWMAFKRYLEDIERYTNLKEATDISEKYLPYAICFGIERSWVRKFAQAGAPAPKWYRPYPPVIVGLPHHYGPGRSWGERRTVLSGEGGSPGGGLGMPSLDNVSDGMFTSLESISDGLFSALDSTANVFTSRPSSSGGGGWSGGGGRGGGGGGGGGGGAN